VCCRIDEDRIGDTDQFIQFLALQILITEVDTDPDPCISERLYDLYGIRQM
jgi:hypothetical protein